MKCFQWSDPFSASEAPWGWFLIWFEILVGKSKTWAHEPSQVLRSNSASCGYPAESLLLFFGCVQTQSSTRDSAGMPVLNLPSHISFNQENVMSLSKQKWSSPLVFLEGLLLENGHIHSLSFLLFLFLVADHNFGLWASHRVDYPFFRTSLGCICLETSCVLTWWPTRGPYCESCHANCSACSCPTSTLSI